MPFHFPAFKLAITRAKKELYLHLVQSDNLLSHRIFIAIFYLPGAVPTRSGKTDQQAAAWTDSTPSAHGETLQCH